MARVMFDSKKELKKLAAIVAALPEDKKKITEGLVADAAFMADQLEILRAHITEKGWSEEYKNGENQYGRKKSSAVEVHTKYSTEYVKTITALANLRGADGGKADDEFLEFIARRKK